VKRTAATLLVLTACAPEHGWTDAERSLLVSMSPIPDPPARPTNAVADDPAAARLGERLFFDTGLSANGKVSCATCHDPARAFQDGQRVPNTLGQGSRNTPAIHVAAWNTWWFWDGRADSAWAQAAGPLLNPIEHGLSPEGVRTRVIEAHVVEFEAVFGPVPEDPMQTLVRVGKALEAYERTLRPAPGRFDAYVAQLEAGGVPDALSPVEEQGLRLFVREDCVSCHNGPLLTDHQFHNLGLPAVPSDGIDPGRARGAGTVKVDALNCAGPYSDAPDECPELRYLDPSFDDWPAAFKTPSLRDVARTAPYMHDGQFASLEAVVAFYDALPGRPLVGHRELTLRPLGLADDERAALVAFLGTLSGEAPP
jgi:cytochrome c peroxidase